MADLRFINAVAARRFGGGEPPADVEDDHILRAIESASAATPFARAAALVSALLRGNVFASAPRHTALLALHCSLSLDGLTLLAPQGVLVGMLHELEEEQGDRDTVVRWLEDRAVPSSSAG